MRKSIGLFETQQLRAALLLQRKFLLAREPSDRHQYQVTGRLHILFQRAQALGALRFQHPPDASRRVSDLFEQVHVCIPPPARKWPPQDDSTLRRRIATATRPGVAMRARTCSPRAGRAAHSETRRQVKK